MTYSLSPFLFINFSTLNSFWFHFFAIFFIKLSNNFFIFKITKNIRPWYKILNILIPKMSDKIGTLPFAKSIFIFRYFQMISNFKFRTFFIILFIKINMYAWLYINRFNGSIICIVVFVTMSSLTLQSFWYWSYIFINFIKVLINISATTDFFIIKCWIHFHIILV